MSIDDNASKRKAAAALDGQFDDSDEDTRSTEAETSTSTVETKKEESVGKDKEADFSGKLTIVWSIALMVLMFCPSALTYVLHFSSYHLPDDEKTERPVKKAKADKTESMPAVSAQDAIQSALARVSKPALSDYEKCSIFPQKLMQLLKNEEAPDAIWWLEDGESFAIEQENFTKVMNKVSRTGKKKVKLDSILRNLYRWGFKKLKDRDLPPNVLAYSHPKFKRDACVELQTFSKKTDSTPSGSSGVMGSAPTALARALSARAQAGYGENWNEEGAADKSMMMAATAANPYAMMGHAGGMMAAMAGGGEHAGMMFMLQQQQHQHQQRQMLLQQELMFHEQQQRQALLYGAAAAEQAYAHRFSGAGGFPGFSHNPYPF